MTQDTTLEKEQKPDGFVAWHPKHGRVIDLALYTHNKTIKLIAQMCLTELGAWSGLIGAVAYSETPEVVIETAFLMRDNGWRIRPVKLVFLDEPAKQIRDLGTIEFNDGLDEVEHEQS